MLNITIRGNANQNHSEISSHACWNNYHQKDEINAGEDVEKRKPLCTAERTVIWYSHYGKQYGGSSEN